MKTEIVFEKLKKMLNEGKFMSIGNVDESINYNTSLINDLALDSIQILELIIAIEKEFGISCDPEELDLSLFDRMDETIIFIINKMDEQNA